MTVVIPQLQDAEFGIRHQTLAATEDEAVIAPKAPFQPSSTSNPHLPSLEPRTD